MGIYTVLLQIFYLLFIKNNNNCIICFLVLVFSMSDSPWLFYIRIYKPSFFRPLYFRYELLMNFISLNQHTNCPYGLFLVFIYIFFFQFGLEKVD